jgi:hypothetical protein
LNGRVGVITHGSVRVLSHSESILNPTTIGRYRPGMILGHGKTDGNITSNTHTWFVTFDDKTEVVFFQSEIFNGIWEL